MYLFFVFLLSFSFLLFVLIFFNYKGMGFFKIDMFMLFYMFVFVGSLVIFFVIVMFLGSMVLKMVYVFFYFLWLVSLMKNFGFELIYVIEFFFIVG